MVAEIQEVFSKPAKALFAGCATIDAVKSRRNSILKKIHPDVCADPDAAEAVRSLNDKFETAVVGVDTGSWPPEGTKTHVFKKRDGNLFRVHAVGARPSHLSDKLDMVTAGYAVYQASDDSSVAGFVNSMKNHVAKKYPKAPYLSDYVPKVTDVKLDGDMLIVAQRPKDSVSIRDVLDYHGQFSAETAAWVISRLLDFCCLMETEQTVHCGLLPDNVFVVPKEHHVVVAGGWQYGKKTGAKLKEVPALVYSAAARRLKDKSAVPAVMLESVKALGRLMVKDPPKPMKSWLFTAAKDRSPEEYSAWEKARDASFGSRKFHDAEFSAENIYNKMKEK